MNNRHTLYAIRRGVGNKAAVLLVAGLGILFAPQIDAAAFTVEAAQLVQPGHCELAVVYSQAGRDADTDNLRAAPSCGVTANVELSAELARARVAGDADTEFELGANVLARELVRGSYGWGFGITSQWVEGVDRHDELVAYVPLSVHVANRLVMHYNIGWANRRDRDDVMIWGVRAEHALHARWTLNGEAYGTDRGGTEFQAGIGFAAGAATFQVAYGRTRDDHRNDWWTGAVAWFF